MKRSPKKYRNAMSLPAKLRSSAGVMRNKKDKRINGKNKKELFLNEDY